MPPKKSPIDNTLVISDIISPVDDDDKFGLQTALSKPARRLRRKTQTKTIQKFIKKRYHADYKNRIMLELEKLKNRAIKKVRIDLTKINIKALATRIGVLSDGLKLTMILPSSNRYYALNDRTINLLMKGKIDTNATIGGPEAPTFSDAAISDLLEEEPEVIVSILSIEKTRPGGAFFPFLNKTIYDLSKYGVFKSVDKNNYNHNCLYLALQAGGLSDVKLQELILTLRNRTIHKCDLTNVCNTLEINIELISIRSDGKNCIVEHYPTSPYIQYDEKYNLGLVKGHYFINDYTELTSYCLENYDEVKDLKESNMIWKKRESITNEIKRVRGLLKRFSYSRF